MTTKQAIFILAVNAFISLVISVSVFMVLERVVRRPYEVGQSLPTTAPTHFITPSSLPQPTQPAPQPTVYIVRPGDTLSTVALRFGVPPEDILRANALADPDFLSVGQELIIPIGGLPSPTPTLPLTSTPTETPLPFEPPTPPPSATFPSVPAVLTTFTPTPAGPAVRIREVISPGDPAHETVLISNAGLPVDMEGWTLSNGKGHIYTFPAFRLWSNEATVQVHTSLGKDTATDLFWNRNASAWSSGSIITLADKEGNVIDTYYIP